MTRYRSPLPPPVDASADETSATEESATAAETAAPKTTPTAWVPDVMICAVCDFHHTPAQWSALLMSGVTPITCQKCGSPDVSSATALAESPIDQAAAAE